MNITHNKATTIKQSAHHCLTFDRWYHTLHKVKGSVKMFIRAIAVMKVGEKRSNKTFTEK